MKYLIILFLLPGISFTKELTVIQAGKAFLPSSAKEKLSSLKNSRGKYKKSKIKEIKIKEITIQKGDSITFINNDTVVHNVFGKGFSFNQSLGSKHTETFDKVGSRMVRCAIHPKMKLKVQVEEEVKK